MSERDVAAAEKKWNRQDNRGCVCACVFPVCYRAYDTASLEAKSDLLLGCWKVAEQKEPKATTTTGETSKKYKIDVKNIPGVAKTSSE